MILLIIGVLIGILGTALIYLIVVDCDRKLLDARMDVYSSTKEVIVTVEHNKSFATPVVIGLTIACLILAVVKTIQMFN